MVKDSQGISASVNLANYFSFQSQLFFTHNFMFKKEIQNAGRIFLKHELKKRVRYCNEISLCLSFLITRQISPYPHLKIQRLR
jgi:hypothetical protein